MPNVPNMALRHVLRFVTPENGASGQQGSGRRAHGFALRHHCGAGVGMRLLAAGAGGLAGFAGVGMAVGIEMR